MKLRIIGLLFLLSGCVNIADHYGVTLCGNKVCHYRDYESRGSALLDTKYDYDYNKILSQAIGKSSEFCLVGYAVIRGSFPKDQDVFDFNWEANVNADYIYYARLEAFDSLLIDPPFKIINLEGRAFPEEIAWFIST